MSTKKVRLAIILFIIGFLFLALDVYVSTGVEYPTKYENDSSIIGEYQYYAIKLFYGATCTYKTLDNVDLSGETYNGNIANAEFVDQVFFEPLRIDVFNDVIALLLIAMSCHIMRKQYATFMAASICSIICILGKLALSALPFLINGMLLCNMAIGVAIAYTAAFLLIIYFTYSGYIYLLQDPSCRDERLWLNTTWFLSLVLFVLISFIKWLELIGLANVFTAILVIDILIFAYILKRAFAFICRNTKA